MKESYRLRLFGRAEIVDGNGTIRHLDSRKALALLGYLARHNRPIAREHLADLLWSDKSGTRGRRNLSRELSEISAQLPGLLLTTYHTVQLNVGHTWVDTAAFETLIKGGTQRVNDSYPPFIIAEQETSFASPFARERIEGWRPIDTAFPQTVRPGIDAEHLAQAIKLYRGEFMAEFYLDGGAEFESWLMREREFWRREVIASIELLMEHYTLYHQDTQAIALARHCLELEPWQEDAHRTLMLLLARNGKRAAALAQYEACRRALKDELGVEPTEETRALYEQIKNDQVTKSQSDGVFKQHDDSRELSPATAQDSVDVALHAPKAEHPIETSLPVIGTLTRRHLPRAATHFIGRQRELNELIACLRDPEARLVTLVALGGMGKTRLALAAAEQLTQQHLFRDGVAFADLSSIGTSAELESALVQALGLPFDNHGVSPRHQLLDYLRTKQLLLMLDNCEHLLGEVARLVTSILHEAPEVSLLATSRERLGLQAEHVLQLNGMSASDDGAELFAASARHARPNFELDTQSRPLVEQICLRLSGMPLAIELAARWINTLSLAAINYELAHNHDLLTSRSRDIAERHRSIRAVYETTWARLQPSEQAVFAQVAVFRGGATWQAIQAVTNATLWQLQTLVEQALIRFDARSERYAVHELLQLYAEEQLRSDVQRERTTRERHATYFLNMLAASEGALKSAHQKETLAIMSADIENLRAAWRWAAETHAIDLIASASESLSLTYAGLGYHEEGLMAMRLAAKSIRRSIAQPSATLATVLAAQARFALLCNDRTQALKILRQAQTLLAVDGAALRQMQPGPKCSCNSGTVLHTKTIPQRTMPLPKAKPYVKRSTTVGVRPWPRLS